MQKIFELSAIYFDTSKREVNKKYQRDIKEIANELKKTKIEKIIIEGHTDSAGSYELNRELSIARAKSVYDELKKNGIPADKMENRGYSYLKPVASNSTVEGRKLNRRGEVSIIADFTRERKALVGEIEKLTASDLVSMSENDSDEIDSSKDSSENALKKLILSAAIFEINSAKLSKESKKNIEQIARQLKKMKYSRLTIEGHTDITGRMKYNKVLSESRAKSVYTELIKYGIPARKMKYVGFAYFLPATSNDTSESRRLNRRVEVFVEK